MQLVIISQGSFNYSPALSFMHHCIWDKIRNEKLNELDNDIQSFDVDFADINTMLAVLVATAPVKDKLPSREDVYKRIKSSIKKHGLLKKGILTGLK